MAINAFESVQILDGLSSGRVSLPHYAPKHFNRSRPWEIRSIFPFSDLVDFHGKHSVPINFQTVSLRACGLLFRVLRIRFFCSRIKATDLEFNIANRWQVHAQFDCRSADSFIGVHFKLRSNSTDISTGLFIAFTTFSRLKFNQSCFSKSESTV